MNPSHQALQEAHTYMEQMRVWCSQNPTSGKGAQALSAAEQNYMSLYQQWQNQEGALVTQQPQHGNFANTNTRPQQLINAGWGSRLVALIIDSVILAIPFFIVMTALGASLSHRVLGDFGNAQTHGGKSLVASLVASLFAFAVASALIPTVYQWLCMKRSSYPGASFGKQVTNLTTVRSDDSEYVIDFKTVVMKYIVGTILAVQIGGAVLTVIVSLIIGPLALFIPFIIFIYSYIYSPLTDSHARSLPDKVAGTRVVAS